MSDVLLQRFITILMDGVNNREAIAFTLIPRAFASFGVNNAFSLEQKLLLFLLVKAGVKGRGCE